VFEMADAAAVFGNDVADDQLELADEKGISMHHPSIDRMTLQIISQGELKVGLGRFTLRQAQGVKNQFYAAGHAQFVKNSKQIISYRVFAQV
jgi:hypothetical protein